LAGNIVAPAPRGEQKALVAVSFRKASGLLSYLENKRTAITLIQE
jgi:hypothetical protein